MAAFQYLARVMRGQVRHWAVSHNPVANELWQRIPLLPHEQQPLYKDLLVACHGIIEALVGMNSGKQLPIAVDCRGIDENGYRQVYSIILGYFVFQLTVLNPRMRQELFESLDAVCGETDERRQLLQRLQRIQTLLPKQERKRPDVAKLGAEVWQALKLTLKARDEPLDWVQFMTFAMSVFNAGLQNLHKSWGADSMES